MFSVSMLKGSKSPFIAIIEGSYLFKNILNHDLIAKLINGTLNEVHFKLLLTQQAWLWYEISQQLIAISKHKNTTYIKPLFSKIANFSLIESDILSKQLKNSNISSYEAHSICNDYLNFLKTLEDKFLFLTAILPRFWLKANLCRRYSKLNLFKHPYKRYIENYFYHDASGHITSIINTLDIQFQYISQEQKLAIKQVFLEATLYECELLNQTDSLVSI